MQNPFNLQQNNRRFFLQVERRNIQGSHDQAEQAPVYSRLHRRGPQTASFGRIVRLARETQATSRQHIRSEERPIREQGSRIRKVLRQKRQTVFQFVRKKKQIFVTNLTINMKKNAIRSDEDRVNGEVSTLGIQRQNFESDKRMVARLCEQIKSEAESAKVQAETLKRQEQALQQAETKASNQAQKFNSLIERAEAQLRCLVEYRAFLQKVQPQGATLRLEPQGQGLGAFFLTDRRNSPQSHTDSSFYPQDLIERLNAMEEANLMEIQTNYDSKEELDKIGKQLLLQRQKNRTLEKDFQEKRRTLQAQRDAALKLNNCLKQQNSERANSTTVYKGEFQVDMVRVGQAIIELHKEWVPGRQLTYSQKSDQLVQYMREIQCRVMAELRTQQSSEGARKRGPELRVREEKDKAEHSDNRYKVRRNIEVVQGRRDMHKRKLRQGVSQVKEEKQKFEEGNQKYFQNN